MHQECLLCTIIVYNHFNRLLQFSIIPYHRNMIEIIKNNTPSYEGGLKHGQLYFSPVDTFILTETPFSAISEMANPNR